MIMVCPQWHLRRTKEHLPASVLGWFLFPLILFAYELRKQFFK